MKTDDAFGTIFFLVFLEKNILHLIFFWNWFSPFSLALFGPPVSCLHSSSSLFLLLFYPFIQNEPYKR